MLKNLWLGAMLLLAGGCSTFNAEWKRAAATPPPANDITGRWEGTWKSDASSHTDKLRALITHQEGPKYEAFFHAKYRKILTFTYKMAMEVKRDSKPVKFDGQADLGKLAGGVYTYNGFATPTNFFCTYQCKYDHGTFEMVRPKE